jgi:anthranilate synthase/aminodeoxychorismate synthase-like glutamine amidotransferase
MIVVLDNRDSFVFNLARHFHLLGVETVVCPSHSTDVAGIASLAPRAIVISPGPCTPAEAGCSIDVVRGLRGRVPMLGVCLGHQAIAAALGGSVVVAAEPVHGRTSPVHHDAVNLFAGIPSPLTACRYHSLVVAAEPLPDCLEVTARDDRGTIMAIADERRGVYGVQFHPESILTRHGFRLLANFLERAGVPHHGHRASLLDEDVARQAEGPAGDDTLAAPPKIVTF